MQSIRSPRTRRPLPGGYHLLPALPTPGRIYLHPFRTLRVRRAQLGDHVVITTARYLQRDKPHAGAAG